MFTILKKLFGTPAKNPTTPPQEQEIVAEYLSKDEQWAYSGEWFSGFKSSNVKSFAYDYKRNALAVEYQGQLFWEYSPVSLTKALSLYHAPSKGTWIWDNIKVRGTIHQHRVGAVLLSGPSEKLPRWFDTPEGRIEHAKRQY